MRIFTELEPDTYERIEQLVSEGKYESIEQFLRVSAQNQLAIERADAQPEISPTQSLKSANTAGGSHWGFEVPESIPTGSPFKEDRSNLLLFSQYYRFFPLKCALYLVARFTAEAEGPALVSEVHDYVADEINPIRDAIVAWEDQNDVKKKNRKSTGLPKKDVKNPERSEKRYLNHYVGKIQIEKMEPTGFSHDMGFISFERIDKEWIMQLTPAGSEFVQITNPILEHGPEAPPLSDEEKEFIVIWIRDELDEEYRFMNYIYDVLANAEQSYTNHLDRFREFLEESSAISGELSENNVRSRVGGAISRMVELGILERGQRRGWYNPRRDPEEYEFSNTTQIS